MQLKNEIKAQPVFKTEEAETKNSELKTDFPKLEAEPVDVIEYPNVCVDFPKKTDPEDGTETPEQDTTARKFYSESEVEKFEKKQIYQNTVLKYRYRWIPENDRQVKLPYFSHFIFYDWFCCCRTLTKKHNENVEDCRIFVQK